MWSLKSSIFEFSFWVMVKLLLMFIFALLVLGQRPSFSKEVIGIFIPVISFNI
jgi:hypothetical protein